MNGRYLLDTNIIIALFAEDRAVKDNLGKAGEVLSPALPLAGCAMERGNRHGPGKIWRTLTNLLPTTLCWGVTPKPRAGMGTSRMHCG